MFFQSCPSYKCSPQECKIFPFQPRLLEHQEFLVFVFLISQHMQHNSSAPLFRWRPRMTVVTISHSFAPLIAHCEVLFSQSAYPVCVTLHISIDIFARWRHVRPPRANINQLEQPGRFTSRIFTACSYGPACVSDHSLRYIPALVLCLAVTYCSRSWCAIVTPRGLKNQALQPLWLRPMWNMHRAAIRNFWVKPNKNHKLDL